MPLKANLVTSNNQLESRMREIRQSGSVGAEPPQNGFPTSIVSFIESPRKMEMEAEKAQSSLLS
jgi:hypothetical protein